jgi:hypothetical protein
MNENTKRQYYKEVSDWNYYLQTILYNRFSGDKKAAYQFIQGEGYKTDPEAPRLTVFKPHISDIVGTDFTETYQLIKNKEEREKRLQPYRNQQKKYQQTPINSRPSSPVSKSQYYESNNGMHMGGRKRRVAKTVKGKRRRSKKHTRKMRK